MSVIVRRGYGIHFYEMKHLKVNSSSYKKFTLQPDHDQTNL